MYLYGRNWTRRQLEARVGRIDHIAGLQRFRMEEGPAAGVELIQVRTGSGLAYYVDPTHALDILLVQFMGVPISWHSVNGEVHPAYYDSSDAEWLRTTAGGLLITCGLTQVGSPGEDNGEQLGQHGRIHHIPARQVVAESNWDGAEYRMRIRGIMEENRIFGENLRLTREINSQMGSNRIIIKDLVENIGFEKTPHMILYHVNFGFPLMDRATEIVFPSQKIVPRDQWVPLDGYDRWQEPEVGYQERVYYHEELKYDTGTSGKKMTTILIKNPEFPVNDPAGKMPLTVRISWNIDTLPRLIEWKMPAAGVNALGIEPANCLVEGRAAERKRGTLMLLDPGAAIRYDLELEIING